MKKYIDAEIAIVRMSNHDIVTTSENVAMSFDSNDAISTANGVGAPGRRGLEDWDAGY